MKLMGNNLKVFDAAIAKLAYMSAKQSANSACHFFYHQPKLPEKVKELRKF
jgi:cyclic lactone autoinducer peptide